MLKVCRARAGLNPNFEMVRLAVRQAHGPELSRRTISNGGSGDPPYVFFSVGPVSAPAKKSSKFKCSNDLVRLTAPPLRKGGGGGIPACAGMTIKKKHEI